MIFFTLSRVGLSSKQVRMASLEVRLRRRTLRCASRSSSFCQQTLASRAEKVLATAKCRKAKHLVVGPPPRCGRSTALGPSNHLEAAMKLESLILADGFLLRYPVHGCTWASPVPHLEDDPQHDPRCALLATRPWHSRKGLPQAPEVGAEPLSPLPSGGPEGPKSQLKSGRLIGAIL